MKTISSVDERPEMLLHLGWVARISLWIGGCAGLGLSVVLYLLSHTTATGQDYGGLIQAYSLAQYRLGPTILIGGLFLLAFTALLTGLIALYSSFRVAGPLFRLSRNLESAISQGPLKPVSIRDSDELHQEADLLAHALSNLASHYDALQREIDQALTEMDGRQISEADRQVICARLQEGISRARL